MAFPQPGQVRTFPGMAESPNIKLEAQRLVDGLPASATSDDVAYEVYVRQSIEMGLADERVPIESNSSAGAAS